MASRLGALSASQTDVKNNRLPAQVRLSERNVVELVSKLQAAALLGPDLLHSINGREYLTVEHLRGEVQGAVESSGGRIPVVRMFTPFLSDCRHCCLRMSLRNCKEYLTLEPLCGEAQVAV